MNGRERLVYSRLRLLLAIVISLTIGTACAEAGPILPGQTDDALFVEPFGPVEGEWRLENDELSRAFVAQEQLLIEVDGPNLVHFVTLDSERFSDFTLDVKMTRIVGDPLSSFGVLFRVQDAGGFYRLALTGEGQFLVELHRLDGSTVELSEGWQQTSALRTELGESNQIRVVAQGSDFEFYANSLLLTRLSDSSLGEGKIALDAGTFGRSGLQVVYDDFVVNP